jgi:lipooligosaccharide transport system permease protein
MTTTLPEAAVEAAVRPRRFGAWYVAEHQLRGMKAYGWTIVVGSVGNPLLYLLGIGLGLATFLDQSVASGANGPVSYVWFVAPALLATAGVTVATDEFTFVIMAGFKWRRIFWGMNASPIAPPQIMAGLVLSVVLRMLFTTTVYYVLIVAFGAVGDPVRGALMPLVGVLAGLAFGLPLMAFSASLTEDKGQFALVQRFVFTPLFLFSGTFYPLSTLPVWLHWVGWISPLWHASEIGRALSYGSPPGAWPVGWHLVILLAMAAVGWVLARRVFVRRLRG